MPKSKNDNSFLYFCQEGKLKSLKKLINSEYQTSKEILHEALYFVLNGNYKNCYNYIIDIFETDRIVIDLYYNNGLIFNKSLLNDKIGKLLLTHVFYSANHKDNFQIYFFNLLKEIKSHSYLEKIFYNLMSTGYLSFIEERIIDIILSKDDYLNLRNKILNILEFRENIKEF